MEELTVSVNLPVRPEEFGGIIGQGLEMCDKCNNPVIIKIAYLVRGILPRIQYKEIILSCSDRALETLIAAPIEMGARSLESTQIMLKITQAKKVANSMDYNM